MTERLHRVIAHPLHRFLGVTDIACADGRAQLSIRVHDDVVNPAGVFHGGAQYALCDVCAYAALLTKMDDNTEAVTHDIQVSVMRPAKLGQVVEFSAEVIKAGRSLGFIDVRAEVEGKIIATARVTKSMISTG